MARKIYQYGMWITNIWFRAYSEQFFWSTQRLKTKHLQVRLFFTNSRHASRTQWQRRCVGEEVVTDAYLNLVYKSIYLVLLRYHCIFSLFTPFSLYSNFLFKKTDVNWAKRMLSSQYRHFQLKSWRPRNSIRSIPQAFFVILLYFQNDRRSKPFCR